MGEEALSVSASSSSQVFESLKRGPATIKIKEVKSWASNIAGGKAPMEEACSKQDVIWEEVDNLKRKVESLEKRLQEVTRFALKIMHRSATTLCLLQKVNFVDDVEEEVSKELLKFLTEDWATITLVKPCTRKKD